MKQCNKCLITKDFNMFEINRHTCKTCRSEQKRLNYSNKKEIILVKKKQYRIDNKVKISNLNKYNYSRNKEDLLVKKKIYYQQNRVKKLEYYYRNKEHISNVKSIYAKNNAAKFAFISAMRRAIKLQATPSWLSNRQIRRIEAYYRLAQYLTQKTLIKHEVDHIMPLQGEDLSGLHVPWNLQILTKSENCSKSNKTDWIANG